MILYQTLDFQLNNPNNYAYYASMVYMGCQTYPYLENRHSSQGKLRAREELLAMPEPIGYRLEGRQTTSTSTNASVVPLEPSQQYVTDDVPVESLGNIDLDGLAAKLRAAGYPPGYLNQ
ncbi:MAG: hypothetical protein OHK93_001951 [Ramalina farinacea]|uniref:Uncharacterized protein n=1 Tax=Ramalina farinacea TaxID=258253 RepID=A0AA43QRB9_9LECA|nr:hypothetical protein [Ramalina farinacea]